MPAIQGQRVGGCGEEALARVDRRPQLRPSTLPCRTCALPTATASSASELTNAVMRSPRTTVPARRSSASPSRVISRSVRPLMRSPRPSTPAALDLAGGGFAEGGFEARVGMRTDPPRVPVRGRPGLRTWAMRRRVRSCRSIFYYTKPAAPARTACRHPPPPARRPPRRTVRRRPPPRPADGLAERPAAALGLQVGSIRRASDDAASGATSASTAPAARTPR